MSASRRRRDRSAPTLEGLEARLAPAVTAVEPFQRAATAAVLPSGWSQWSSGGGTFAVDAAGAGLGDTGRLVTDGTSATAGRAWMTAPFGPDVETSAAVYLNTAVPVQLFARGQALDTTRPTYYAAAVGRGVEVQLTRVVAGVTTVLGSVKSTDYVSGKWVTVTLRAAGDVLKVYVYRGD